VADLLEISGLSKSYGGLRPLRLRHLQVTERDRIGLAGFDQTTAEVFVNLVTGATLPEEGVVRVFGRATSDIADTDDWLATVDRFGIVSERVVLLDQYTIAQNIAMSLTLDIEPIPAEALDAVRRLGREVGLAQSSLDERVGDVGVARKHRVRLARAIAANPSLVIVEHPAAGLGDDEKRPLAEDLARAADARSFAVIVLAATSDLARPFVPRVLTLDGASGELKKSSSGGLLGRLRSGLKGS
jgi:ABC-type branched-subunit amino acid transport system ATPase component